MDQKLQAAKRYLQERGIRNPRVKVGALYSRPMTWQQPITGDMSYLQTALIGSGNGRVRGPRQG